MSEWLAEGQPDRTTMQSELKWGITLIKYPEIFLGLNCLHLYTMTRHSRKQRMLRTASELAAQLRNATIIGGKYSFIESIPFKSTFV